MKSIKKHIENYKIVYIVIGTLLLYLTPLIIFIIKESLNRDLIIVLSGSKETFNKNDYYKAICPYTNIKCETFTLPYHDKNDPFKYWKRDGIESIVNSTNNEITKILNKYKPNRLILAGISRGGYLASMYIKADIYLLFSPVLKWTELNEFDNDGTEVNINNLKKKRVFGFVNSNDYRVNGSIIVNFFNKICNNCKTREFTFINHDSSSHSVPINIFKRGAEWINK